ncbi:Riboflavin synthase [Pseudomonas fluorescens]|nr:Riboflavin synthase [Pseudomonas fluorescens]
MYTGIVQELGEIISLDKRIGVTGVTVRASARFMKGLEVGGSIALNGVCLTATKIRSDEFCADVSDATQAITNLMSLKQDDRVNLERSAYSGGEVGGHLTAGHIDGTGLVTAVAMVGETIELSMALPQEAKQYIFVKGFVAINGASLTVGSIDIESNIAKFTLVPETLRRTTFKGVKVGDKLNVEVDPVSRVLVDTVRRVLSSKGDDWS